VVPEGLTDEAEEWNGYARLLFRRATRKMAQRGNTTGRPSHQAPHGRSEDTLKEFLADTEAEGLFVGAKEALSSARFILCKVFDPHPVSQGGRGVFDPPLAGGRKRRQFCNITWREDMLEALKPLVSTWVDILCTST